MSTTIDRRAAFHAIARGEKAEVPYLVAAWQHLLGHEYGAEEFAQAYINFVKKWDWDWVKINPRAIYYAESWGGKYDPENYDGYVIPKKLVDGIQQPQDVAKIAVLDPTNAQEAPYFAEHIEGVRLIRQGLADRGVIQSVFSPLSVLLQLADLPLYPGDDYATPTLTVADIIDNQPEVAKQALHNIAQTLAAYVSELVKPESDGGVGLDGIFYAVTGTVSENYFDRERYEEFSLPYDRIVIDAIRAANPDAVVLVHTCRADSHPEWFAELGADIVHWDQYAEGNPHVDADLGAVPVAGANYLEFNEDGDPEQVAKDLQETIALAGDKQFLLAPSCTVPTPASEASLAVLSKIRAY